VAIVVMVFNCFCLIIIRLNYRNPFSRKNPFIHQILPDRINYIRAAYRTYPGSRARDDDLPGRPRTSAGGNRFVTVSAVGARIIMHYCNTIIF